MSDTSAWKRWLDSWRHLWKNRPEPTGPTTAAPPREVRETPSRQRRASRREQLYAVVRETMIRAGLLSSAYKFKVLTLDHEGLSHVVLLDVRREAIDLLPDGPQSLEDSLRQLARERLDLDVKSLYWRWWDEARATPPAPTSAQPPHEEITRDEIEALRQALHSRAQTRSSPGHAPDFEPTRPMPRRQRHDDHPLSDTQMGDLS